MLSNIDSATEEDLIRELSPESFNYFTETELGAGWKSYERLGSTKFIRIGVGSEGRIILGSTIDFGPLREVPYKDTPRRGTIYHKDLLAHAHRNLGLTDEDVRKILESRERRKMLSGDGFMLDAGKAKLLALNATKFVLFSGYSVDFGNADEAGRVETTETARLILGEGFEVASELK